MAMGRNLRVYHNLGHAGPGQGYSLILEHKALGEMLLVEDYAIDNLSPQDFQGMKQHYTKLTDSQGCLGILRVNDPGSSSGGSVLYYLVLVTASNSAGKVGTSEIYRITNVCLVSMRGGTQQQMAADEDKMSEVKKLLTCGTFYFSWSSSESVTALDLTLSAQKAAQEGAGGGGGKNDNRFFWNRMFYVPFIRHGIDANKWLLKVMCGSAEIRTVYVGSKQAKAAVFSRLSSERAGTRFQTRGVDDSGHVANFAESEQVIFMGDEVSSYLQIRGSVPLFWDQPGVNVGSHKIRMSRGPELSATAFDEHLKQLKYNYGHQAIVNLLGSSLVGSKEGEATLSTAFQTHHKACEHHTDIPHILFDYHQEGAKNLGRLKNKLHKYSEKFGFFTKKGSDITREQYGTVRTNCIDCLDRTNCVQTFLGLEVLQYQLRDLDLSEKPNIVSRFEEMFKQMWQNNGNELSKMYAGTGAMGASSKLIDGARSAARTIQNNLLDSSKQEAIDIILLGSSYASDLADRARVLLPNKYINAPRPILERLVNRHKDFTEPLPLRVAMGTYNINGGKHFRSIVYKNVSLSDWIYAHKQNDVDDKRDNRIDIYAFGFEEMVDLDAKNIMNTSSENAKGWAQELTKTLNTDGEKFTLVTFQQLVGVCLYVFIRPDLAPHIKDVAVDTVKTGMGGATGNKGSVAIRFLYHSTSLCFVCSHFAAGQSGVSDRNNDFNEAVNRISFPKGRNLLSHDYIFWCGDFNYRINLPRDEVKSLVAEENWEELRASDQLKVEYLAGNVFSGFQEGPVNFAPTYKYDLFSDDYDTSEKQRIPAWTDRVLWRRRKYGNVDEEDGNWSPGKCHFYGRAELKQSDHRPILAVLDIDVLKLNSRKREDVFTEELTEIGPPEGNVILQFENMVAADVQKTVDDKFMSALTAEVNKIGQTRFVRFKNEVFSAAFVDHARAPDAVKVGLIKVCDHELTIRLKHPDWKVFLDNELLLCSSATVKLNRETRDLNLKRESAKLLSQLSQLSFEELEDITLPTSESGPPPRPGPPPPRPGPPPGRPAQPPSRPAAPPSRPKQPPSRPEVPPSPKRPIVPEQQPQSKQPKQPQPESPKRGSDSSETEDEPETPLHAPSPDMSEEPQPPPLSKQDSEPKPGFSGIFSITSPLEETNHVPMSSSSGSIVAMTTSTSEAPTAEDLDEAEEGDEAIERKTQVEPPRDLPLSSPITMKGETGTAEKSSPSSSSTTTPGTPSGKMLAKRGAAPPPPPPPRGAPPPLPNRGAPPPVPRR